MRTMARAWASALSWKQRYPNPNPNPNPNLTLTLTRYDETDFESYVTVMRQCGLWLYEAHEKRLYESHDGVTTSREAYQRMGALDRS